MWVPKIENRYSVKDKYDKPIQILFSIFWNGF